MARLAFLMIFGIMMTTPFMACRIILRNPSFSNPILWELISSAGVLLAVNALTFLHRDLKYSMSGKTALVLVDVFFFALLGITYLLFVLIVLRAEINESWSLLRMGFAHFCFSSRGILLLGIGIALSWADVRCFRLRLSYLE